ncbi:hypothetical protein B0H19DRAFT_647560 [Mycena capillaripes]|nr:hypothetical protein B0H19DRAFT_647560 [Mycena capillaripes]
MRPDAASNAPQYAPYFVSRWGHDRTPAYPHDQVASGADLLPRIRLRLRLRCRPRFLPTSSLLCSTFSSQTVSSLRRAYCAAAWLLRARLFPALVYALPLGLRRPAALHPPAPARGAHVCILGDGRPRNLPPPSSFHPMSHPSFCGAAYFRADGNHVFLRADDGLHADGDWLRQWGVAEKVEVRCIYLRVRVRVYVPWRERNTRDRGMGGERERGGRRRTHCDAGPPPCGRSASGWDDAIARRPARGESPPGQLIHSSLYISARSTPGPS